MAFIKEDRNSAEKSTPFSRFQERELNFNVFIDDYLNIDK